MGFRLIIVAALSALVGSARAAVPLPPPPPPAAPSERVVIERGEWLTVEAPTDNAAIDAAVMASASEVQGPMPPKQPGDFYVREGEFSGLWLRGKGRNALRLRFSERPPYHVAATLHCAKRAADCGGLRARLDALEAPEPAWNHASYSGWVRVVAHEPCKVRGPVSMTAPPYPRDAQVYGFSGTVQLRIVYNGCGTVRGAEVVRTSGWKNLDAAAVNHVKTWVVGVAQPGLGGQAMQSIQFELQ